MRMMILSLLRFQLSQETRLHDTVEERMGRFSGSARLDACGLFSAWNSQSARSSVRPRREINRPKQDWEPRLVEVRHAGHHAQTGAVMGLSFEGVKVANCPKRFPKLADEAPTRALPRLDAAKTPSRKSYAVKADTVPKTDPHLFPRQAFSQPEAPLQRVQTENHGGG